MLVWADRIARANTFLSKIRLYFGANYFKEYTKFRELTAKHYDFIVIYCCLFWLIGFLIDIVYDKMLIVLIQNLLITPCVILSR